MVTVGRLRGWLEGDGGGLELSVEGVMVEVELAELRWPKADDRWVSLSSC